MEKKKYVERVTITFTTDGLVKGLSQEVNTIIIDDDGTILSEVSNGAEVLDEDTLSKILPDTSTLLSQISELQNKEITTEDTIPTQTNTVEARKVLSTLYDFGLLDQVEAFISTQPKDVQINWERATTFSRTNSLLVAGAEALGITSEQLDTLFKTAMAKE